MVPTAELGPGELRDTFHGGGGESLAHDVVVVDQLPHGRGEAAPGMVGQPVVFRVGRVGVIGEGNLLGKRLAGGVLGRGEQAVVGVAEQILALVPGDGGGLAEHADAEVGMRLVATALLPLAQVAGMDVGHRVHDGAGAAAALEVLQALVKHGAVVEEHAHGDQGLDVRDVPVGPEVGGSEPVAVVEETMDHRINVGPQHILETLLVGGLPVGADAQQFAHHGELRGEDAAEAGYVVARGNLVRGGGPFVADANGRVGMGPVSADIPADEVEVGGVGVARGALAAVADVAASARTIVGPGERILDERLPTLDPRRLARGDLCLHAIEIGERVQTARMIEGRGGLGLTVRRGMNAGHRRQQAREEDREAEGQAHWGMTKRRKAVGDEASRDGPPPAKILFFSPRLDSLAIVTQLTGARLAAPA